MRENHAALAGGLILLGGVGWSVGLGFLMRWILEHWC